MNCGHRSYHMVQCQSLHNDHQQPLDLTNDGSCLITIKYHRKLTYTSLSLNFNFNLFSLDEFRFFDECDYVNLKLLS
jgi:hypothetical protein